MNNKEIEKLNGERISNIVSQFSLSKETEKVLINNLVEDNIFRSFCKKYSELHGKTKQVKKEFLLVLAYSSKSFFNISDYTSFQQQKNDASSIENLKNGLEVLEMFDKVLPNGLVKDVVSIPFFDGSNLIKNITFAAAEYSNVTEVKDVLETIKNNGHVELNSIIKSATNNKKLFYAYMAEMHKKEKSFVHNYIPKEINITEEQVDKNFDNLLKNLNLAQVLYQRLSNYNKKFAFFCDTNDLINIMDKSVYYLKLNKDNLLKEKDHQFTSQVFAHYHHRVGLEIIKRCINGEFEKIDYFLQNNLKDKKESFLDSVNKNYSDYVQILNEFYYSQTKKNIGKISVVKPIIDFFSIKNSFTHSLSHLKNLKEYVSSDVDMNINNLTNIEKIENNINLLIHNLKIYNEKNNTYTENSSLLNQAIGGKIKYSLPVNLQLFEIVDFEGKKIKNKNFNNLFNETSNLYKELLTGDCFLKNEKQVSLLMLSKSNFETFKASGRFDEVVIEIINKIKIKMEEDIGDTKRNVLKKISSHLELLTNKNKELSENDILGILMNSINIGLSIKSLGGDLLSMVNSSLKIMDKASGLLEDVKVIALNNSIYMNNINEIIVGINNDNKKIVSDVLIKKRELENINTQISINKVNDPNSMNQVKTVKSSVQKFLDNCTDEKLDDRVDKYIKKRI